MRLLFLTDSLLYQLVLIQLYCKGFWQSNPHAFLLTQNLPLLTGQGSCVTPLILVHSASLSYMYLDTKEAAKPEGHTGGPASQNV